MIACEDTRRTRALLSALEIPAPRLERLDANTEDRAGARVLDHLRTGSTVALVTDAGMPTVSDPGARLVRDAAAAGLPIEVIPGPSAVTAAIALAGLDAGDWVQAFIGFLPRTASAINARLEATDGWGVPIVAFEAPSRLPRTLRTLAARHPHRRVVVCREPPSCTSRSSAARLTRSPRGSTTPPAGEVTLVPRGDPPRPAGAVPNAALDAALAQLRHAGLGAKQASEIAALLTGLPRRALYRRMTGDADSSAVE